jgi:hypothetical protein
VESLLLFSLIFSGLLIGLMIAVFLLFRAYQDLKREHVALVDRVERQRKDLVGLCAAAVQVDRRLLQQDQRMREYVEKMETMSAQYDSNQPYYTAIERVKKGAAPQELVSEYGLSLSEANLLVSLYSQMGK